MQKRQSSLCASVDVVSMQIVTNFYAHCTWKNKISKSAVERIKVFNEILPVAKLELWPFEKFGGWFLGSLCCFVLDNISQFFSDNPLIGPPCF